MHVTQVMYESDFINRKSEDVPYIQRFLALFNRCVPDLSGVYNVFLHVPFFIEALNRAVFGGKLVD